MNLNDCKTLDTQLHLEAMEVGLLRWSPATAYVQPFNGWSKSSPPLAWYSDYNAVKHNRQDEFSRASLNNVRLAIAAQFALLTATRMIDQEFGTREVAASEARREQIYPGYQFSLLL